MNIRISRGKFEKASLEAISSKSYVHRQMIAGALCDNKIRLYTNIISKDMLSTASCLKAMGADIEQSDDGFLIKTPVIYGSDTQLNCGESGSTARFLLPLSAHFYNNVKMTGSGRLPQRPFKVLCDVLRENGAAVSSDFLPINISGGIKSGNFKIAGNVSSQYITGLLLTLPLLTDGDSKISLTSELESSGYIDITLEVLRQFGIDITSNENGFFIKGGQSYLAGAKDTAYGIKTEGDWSNGAYLLCMGALCGEISLSGLNPGSAQGDRDILSVLKEFGAEVSALNDCVTVKHKELRGICRDAKNIPDLVPALAVVAAFADGESIFRNVGRLRIKESDRIEEIINILRAIGAGGEVLNGENDIDLKIKPVFRHTDEVLLDGANDHRIVMAGAIASLGADKSVIINGAEAVSKSYPGFFDMCRDILLMDVNEV